MLNIKVWNYSDQRNFLWEQDTDKHTKRPTPNVLPIYFRLNAIFITKLLHPRISCRLGGNKFSILIIHQVFEWVSNIFYFLAMHLVIHYIFCFIISRKYKQSRCSFDLWTYWFFRFLLQTFKYWPFDLFMVLANIRRIGFWSFSTTSYGYENCIAINLIFLV